VRLAIIREEYNNMNPLNYASLEASKRLEEKRIVLKTESAWYKSPMGEWKLIRTNNILYERERYDNPSNSIPAPCMAEVWRELPESIINNGVEYTLCLDKVKVKATGGVATTACYEDSSADGYTKKFYANANPTDALIDLLIYIKGEQSCTPK
jgi:hypothetical protein